MLLGVKDTKKIQKRNSEDSTCFTISSNFSFSYFCSAL